MVVGAAMGAMAGLGWGIVSIAREHDASFATYIASPILVSLAAGGGAVIGGVVGYAAWLIAHTP